MGVSVQPAQVADDIGQGVGDRELIRAAVGVGELADRRSVAAECATSTPIGSLSEILIALMFEPLSELSAAEMFAAVSEIEKPPEIGCRARYRPRSRRRSPGSAAR